MRNFSLKVALATMLLLFAFVAPASAGVAPIVQEPDTTGMSFLAGSSLTISWVSVSVPEGSALSLYRVERLSGGSKSVLLVADGLPLIDSYEVTIPSDGGPYFYFLSTTVDVGGGVYEQFSSNAYWADADGYGWWFTIDTLPEVTLNPYAADVPEGMPATFYAGASGVPEPTCQWQVDTGSGSWADIDGATGTSYETADTTMDMNGWRYRAVFTNRQGSAYTDEVALTVTPAPSITQLPAMGGQTYDEGSKVMISWNSEGLDPTDRLILIQEYSEPDGSGKGWPIATDLDQSGSYEVTIPIASAGTKYSYWLCTGWDDALGATGVFSDQYGQFFDVVKFQAPITLTPNTTGQGYLAGSSLDLSWTSSGLPEGATLSLYLCDSSSPGSLHSKTIATGLPQNGSTSVTIPSSGGPYFYFLEYIEPVGGGGVHWWSDSRYDYEAEKGWWFTIDYPPQIDSHPLGQSVQVYEPATFEASATGLPAPTCQWQVNDGSGWADIDGATDNSYTVPEASDTMNGWLYRAVFTNKYGSATTDEVALTVIPEPAITQTPAMTGLKLFATAPLTINWTSVSLDPNAKLTLYLARVLGPDSYYQSAVATGLEQAGSRVVTLPAEPGMYFYYLHTEWTDADGLRQVNSDQYLKQFEVVPAQEISISAPTMTPPPKGRRDASFAATVTPAPAASAVSFTLHLARWEAAKINGRRTMTWVEYPTLAMTVTNADLGKIGASGKPLARGDWKMWVTSTTGGGFASGRSTETLVTVR